ncbi:MAG: TlpA disulfide reductase family protein [Calditrichaceae bacterium]
MRLFLLFVIAGFLSFTSILLAGDENTSTDLKIDDDAPVFSLPDKDGNYVFLRDFCGGALRKPWINKEKKAVVISFFATWCVPCKKEIPYLLQLKTQFNDKPVEFILIDVGENREEVEPFLQQENIDLTVLFDHYQVVSEKYGATSLPRLIVVSKGGKVKKYQKGFEDPDIFMADMQELIGELVAK